MDLVEGIFQHLATRLHKKQIKVGGQTIDFTKPFKRIEMTELIKQYAKVDFSTIKTDAEAIKLAKEHKIEIEPHQNTRGHIINLFFEQYCEKECIQPTFVHGHPVEISPLAKKNSKDPRYTERFEIFIGGHELGNAFSELNDPIDQQQRFENQIKERERGNTEANEMD
jgi:lysyl-tRNA synthetase class 2